MSTPVFDAVLDANPFKAFPTEYTDRYTPEVARQQGVQHGERQATERFLKRLKAIKNPTKQITTLIRELEDADE